MSLKYELMDTWCCDAGVTEGARAWAMTSGAVKVPNSGITAVELDDSEGSDA